MEDATSSYTQWQAIRHTSRTAKSVGPKEISSSTYNIKYSYPSRFVRSVMSRDKTHCNVFPYVVSLHTALWALLVRFFFSISVTKKERPHVWWLQALARSTQQTNTFRWKWKIKIRATHKAYTCQLENRNYKRNHLFHFILSSIETRRTKPKKCAPL